MAHSAEPGDTYHDKNNTETLTTEDDQSSLSSAETQQGVKGIEAISSTWSTSALIIAYVGYALVLLHEYGSIDIC